MSSPTTIPGRDQQNIPPPCVYRNIEVRDRKRPQYTTNETKDPTKGKHLPKRQWRRSIDLVRATARIKSMSEPPEDIGHREVSETESRAIKYRKALKLAPDVRFPVLRTGKEDLAWDPRLEIDTLLSWSGHYPQVDLPPHPNATRNYCYTFWDYRAGRVAAIGTLYRNWRRWVSFVSAKTTPPSLLQLDVSFD